MTPSSSPAEMRRASDLLAFGPEIPEQYRFNYAETEPLRFAIKRHRASKLHTDIRLEAFRSLLSWASYPRPSLDPQKPIALREMADHNPRYIDGERRIPEGGYGAGPMIVWDWGTYRPLLETDEPHDYAVVSALRAARRPLVRGERLKGGFRFELGCKGWTMTKLPDRFARDRPEPWEDFSVITQRTLDDVEREYQASLMRGRIGRSRTDVSGKGLIA